MRRVLLGFAVVLLAVPANAQKKIISPEGAALDLPFSAGVLSGDLLYVAGQIGNKPGTLELPDGIEAQVRQAMDNLGAVLEAAGMDFSRVVSANVYLSDTRHFQTMNEIYKTYFDDSPPIRATVQADVAIPGALVEIAMIAARPGVERKIITPSGMKSPQLPYSWGIQVGNTLFIAGATARNPDTYEPQGGDMRSQTRRVLQNVGLVLEQAGMSYEDVVNCRVYLDDARYFQDMNEVYRTFFTEAPPSRATVRSKLMNPAFLAEIQCTAVKDASRQVVAAPGAARSSSPFSPGIRVGDQLFLAGMVGRGPDGLAAGDVKSQTKQALENVRATLSAAGMTFDDVVNVTVFLSDVRYYQAMNEVYAEVMPKPAPARATVGTPLMSPDALVEIMMQAEK